MMTTPAPEGVTLTLRAPRRHLCLALPEGFEPPASPERQTRLARAVADALGLPVLTPVCREIAHNVWMCAFLHGAGRPRRAATYENGRPGSVAYVPRSAELALVDWPHGLLYVSGPTPERLPDLLIALNGTLFPTRRPAAPFLPLAFDLASLRLLAPDGRQPPSGTPWERLSLKSLTWREPGEGASLARRLWPGDGFAEFDATGDPWPRRLVALGMTVVPAGARRAYVAEFFQGEGFLRATLSPVTLRALAALIALADVSEARA